MRLNNVSDTHHYCSAIASRCDLEENQKKEFPFGALDCKATDDEMIGNHQAIIQNGPTTELGLPPFSWNDWPQYAGERNGMPSTFDFPKIFIDPSSNFTSSSVKFEKQIVS